MTRKEEIEIAAKIYNPAEKLKEIEERTLTGRILNTDKIVNKTLLPEDFEWLINRIKRLTEALDLIAMIYDDEMPFSETTCSDIARKALGE